MQKLKAKPFIKWAGGKKQLINQFQEFYPNDLNLKKIDKYIEPFVGGGAIFFDIMQKFEIKSAYISDINKDLILTYNVIKKRPELLCDFLEQYQKEYNKTEQDKRNNLFLSVRKHFNNQRFEINYKQLSDNWIPRAAQLIFLNKTCFNGLFRLNSKGEFNVPYGKYLKPTILDDNNIFAVSKILENVEIRNTNYTECFNEVTANSFIYFDPPYKPISKTANFTTYSGLEFTDKQQLELASFYKKLDSERHAKLMLSNSDPKNENIINNFFETAYKGFNIHRVSANRAINCNGEKRGKISELVITNYI